MTVDTNGNDVTNVLIPITGFLAVQLKADAPALVAAGDGAKSPLTLPEGYVKVGLLTDDGGPSDSEDSDDAIEFFQSGYKISGDVTRTMTVTIAEWNDTTRQLMYGTAVDTNGAMVVDGDNGATFPAFLAIVYKSGVELRRSGYVRVNSVSPAQDERGSVKGFEIEFEWVRNDELGGFYREWRIPAPTASTTTTTPGK